MKHWLAAFRLKTLPLALGAIVLGSALPTLEFNPTVFVMAAITAVLLQILSNLANDYGDFLKGTDKHRKDRQLAGGKISLNAMKWMIGVFIVLSLGCGLYLLHVAFGDQWQLYLIFLLVGLLAIAAAIGYTVGKKAYGYYGLGDLFVLLFFGIVGVLGTSFLMHPELEVSYFFAALAYGCLCVGVLNINNIRDLDKDILSNKITLASKLGKSGALNYQALLLLTAVVGFAFHHFLTGRITLAPIACIMLGIINYRRLSVASTSEDYNNQLKFLSLGSFAIVILFVLRLYY